MEPPKLTAAKYKVLEDFPYFSSIIYSMVTIEKPGIMTTAVDAQWKLYYDPQFVAEQTTMCLAGALVHEVEHCLRGHLDRCSTRDPKLWNIAGDMEINDSHKIILDNIPKEFCRLPDEIQQPCDLPGETYYDVMMQNAKQQAQMKAKGSRCGGCSGNTQPWEDPSDTGPNGEEGKGQFDQTLIKTQVAKDIQTHGNAPEHLKRWANEVLNPTIPWERELRAIITQAIQRASNPTDFTYRRPQRKVIADFIFPRTIGFQPTIGVWIDTSGSMYCSNRFDKAAAELKGLLKGRKLLIATGDTALATFQKDVTSLSKVTFEGGGGTDVEAGITELWEKANRKMDIMIVVTDMETSWGHRVPPVKTIIVNVGDADTPGPAWKHKRINVT